MALIDIVESEIKQKPIKMCIYGQHGIGKTTFACMADKPILMQTEEGADYIAVDKLPLADKFEDIIGYFRLLVEEQHDYQTLVIDSLDWLELLIHKYVAKTRGKQSIADFDFGRGYAYSLEQFMKIIAACDILRNKGMNICFTAHCKSEEFKCPLNGVYNRYSLDVHKSIASKINHWCDLVGFAHFDARVISDDAKFGTDHKRIKGGKRIIGFEDTPSYDAKRRFTIASSLPLDGKAFWESVNAR